MVASLGLGTAHLSFAQKVHRVAFLGNSTAALEANLIEPFREGLRDHGYVEGKNIEIEYRWAEGRYDRFPKLIEELIASKVEVIVTAGTPATLAVKKATTTVPLVMVAVGDPVGTGIVPSLSRPGGNITGLTSIAFELEGKRLDLLQQVVPALAHIAVLWNSANPIQAIERDRVRVGAEKLRMTTFPYGVRSKEGLEKAFAAISKEKPGALMVLADRLFLHHRADIINFAAKHRLPTISAYRELVDAGGLMSFGPSYPGMHRRAAYFVDRILKGANPGELPVERPSSFELIINLKAARALDVVIPPAVIFQATEVIE